jgi:radical SAM protein with 4Fe4S-binding SPASM domain
VPQRGNDNLQHLYYFYSKLHKMKRKLLDILSGRKITDIESIQESQAFCMKPWVHLFVSQYGSVVPCCLTPWDKNQSLGDINERTVQEIWNGTEMKQFRSKLLKDQRDDRCKQCYQSEQVGLRSTRQMTNALYGHKLDWVKETKSTGYSTNSKPIFWDIRISNLCNFKCRICGHHSSSQWYNDAKALDLISHDTKIHRGPKDFDLLLQQLDFVVPDLEEIYFAGGEPLIMEEHYRILDLLIERGLTHVKLRYATNFSQTVYKGIDVFEKWGAFEQVHVHASLDGMNEQGEYQRKGQSWKEVIANRERMLNICPHVEFLITSTISIYNVFSLAAFHQDWVKSGLCAIDDFMPHTLRSPNYLSVTTLPAALKDQARQELNKHIEWIKQWAVEHPPASPSAAQLTEFKERFNHLAIPQETEHLKLNILLNEFKNCITFMDSADSSHLLPEFIAFNEQLDALREEDTRTIFPELAPIYNGAQQATQHS